MSLQEKLIEICKDMSEDMLAEVINFAEYVQHKNDVQNNSKGEEIKMEKEKMVEFKKLVGETHENIKKIIRLIKKDEDFKKIDSFDIFREEGNSDIVDDLLADFQDAINILDNLEKEA